jgi:hypothetical protein
MLEFEGMKEKEKRKSKRNFWVSGLYPSSGV